MDKRIFKKTTIILLSAAFCFISFGLSRTAGDILHQNQTNNSQSGQKMKSTKRSMVIGTRGVVATSQPLAAQAGLDVLKKGGNAIDAAIATAAVLNVVEPMSTGIGGDAFIIIYLAKDKKLVALNASGRSAYNITREKVLQKGHKRMPGTGILTVTVPGAFDGWCTALEKYGTMGIEEVLKPAIYYAENGFAVTEIIQNQWARSIKKLSLHPDTKKTYLINGRAPEVGEIFVQKNFAKTLKTLAKGGRDAFYIGEIARQIVRFSNENEGFLSMKDFEDHHSEWVEPIYTNYKNYRLYECPPNGQGVAALEMLNILENVNLKELGHNSAEYLHYLIEAKKLAYADIGKWVGDPSFNELPIDRMTSKDYGRSQFERIDPHKAMDDVQSGISSQQGDTIYLTVMDKDGNAVSFINSIYSGFGSGLVAGETGICLQNRGGLFSLEEGHVNVLEPHKRPFHTIIPAMAFKDGEFFMTFGVMGGAMQPQGHVQVMLNIVEFGMNIQEAIEAPRFRHFSGTRVMIEPEIGSEVRTALIAKAHTILPHRFGSYGGGQGIVYKRENGVMLGGSDFRKDGMAVAW